MAYITFLHFKGKQVIPNVLPSSLVTHLNCEDIYIQDINLQFYNDRLFEEIQNVYIRLLFPIYFYLEIINNQ